MTDTQVPGPPPIHADDPDDEWSTAATAGRFLRVRYLTGGLLILAAVGGGFWGGVVAEKHHGSGSSPAASTFASRFGGGRSAIGSGGFGAGGTGAGATGTATTGQVIDVEGSTVSISDSNGNIVKITVVPSTRITRTASVAASGLQIGDTVVVSGNTGSGGAVSATAIRATAAGTATGAGGTGSSGSAASGSGG